MTTDLRFQSRTWLPYVLDVTEPFIATGKRAFTDGKTAIGIDPKEREANSPAFNATIPITPDLQPSKV